MTLFTAGYQGRSPEQFVQDLARAGVRVLVDVRFSPYSRKPGFSKMPLARSLQQAGIAYRHLRALGCPTHIRDQYRTDNDWDRYTRHFMEHLHLQSPAIEELRALAVSQPVAVLCYEADFNRCHRAYVARAAARLAGAAVCHITASGLVVEQPEVLPLSA